MKSDEDSYSAKYLILVLIASIFVGETSIMVFIKELPPLSELQEALLDSSLLALITFPIIYFVAFKPLNIKIVKLKQAESELFSINQELSLHKKELEETNFELKRANLALKESTELYAELFNSAPVSSLVISKNGIIIESNYQANRMLGFDRDSVTNLSILSFIPSDESNHWENFFQKVSGNGEKQSTKLIIKRRDGSVFYALVDCRRDDPLISTNIRMSFTDITKENWISFT